MNRIVSVGKRMALYASLLLALITVTLCAVASVAAAGNWFTTAAVVAGFMAAMAMIAYCSLAAAKQLAAAAPIVETARTQSRTGDPAAPTSRGRFDAIATERLRTGLRCAILLVDIDDFGRINEQHGFSHGDALLLLVGERLRRATPGAEAVAHLFDDKFGVFACGLSGPGETETLALQLSRAFNEPLFYDDISVRVSVSIGIAEAPADGTSVDELMQAANHALAIARTDSGAAWRTYNPLMRHTNDSLRRALPSAIFNREIVPYYQPIVDLESGLVVGLEVLARWNHPTRGLLLPEAFIPLADGPDVLTDLTISLLRDVTQDSRAWPERLFFGINVAPGQLQDVAEFASSVAEMPGLPFDRIEVELTENALLHDIEATRQAVSALRERGARIVLDDFGAGYGNFHHLRTVPFDRIKIDREFALDILTDERAGICIRSIVQVAAALKIDVTAKGVSTPEIAARVIQLGCRFGQGGLFSMPVPVGDVPGILDRLGVPPSNAALPDTKPAKDIPTRWASKPEVAAWRHASRGEKEDVRF